ncbi:MAG: rhamnulokinase [Blastochloris sp.]|nr:rhamnulokinase [Blastochloris sp.]
MAEKSVIAVDLGAESGRVIRVSLGSDQIGFEQVHRFPNQPVMVRGSLRWDALRLWYEIEEGLRPTLTDTASIGVDTWGVDFALLDRAGDLLTNPTHYRDSQKDGSMDYVFARVPRRVIFERTGIQFMVINGLFQLATLLRDRSPVIDSAAYLLSMADLFNYWLTGTKACEFTVATTLQMFNPRLNAWDIETLRAIDAPTHMLTPIVQPMTRLGSYHNVPVHAVGCHDTASAVVAVPTTTENYAYISSGTWSLMGLEIDQPVIDDLAYGENVTNEGGVGGKYRLLKNIAGMWLAQQCRAAWRGQGQEYSYDQLAQAATEAQPYQAFIDPDDALFLRPGDMPASIREFCRRSGQAEPEHVGDFMRVIYEHALP